MAEINHELWRIVAAGHLVEWRDTLLAITDVNHRRLIVREGWIKGYIAARVYLNLGLVTTQSIMDGLSWYIKNQDYAPEIACEPPIPKNAAVADGVLAADDPGEDLELHVYSWDGLRFAHVGPLAENSQPGPGAYVLVVHDENGTPGLPSQYLTIS